MWIVWFTLMWGLEANAFMLDFDAAMQPDLFAQSIAQTGPVVGIDGNQLYAYFKQQYEKYNVLRVCAAATVKIPKIIHQIWIGSTLPKEFEAFVQSWIDFHSNGDWRYILWDDAKIAQLSLYNQAFYDAAQNFGQKADIARWEILYHFGGLYVDMDCECLRSFDDLHYAYDLYVGLQPLDSQVVQLNNALVGAAPNHPVIQHCILTIPDDWNKYRGVPQTTGPVHFTRSFYLMANKYGTCDIALPAPYFYPLGVTDKYANKKMWQEHGAYAVHWWAKSWMPKEYRPAAFRAIDNDKSAARWNERGAVVRL